MTNEPKEPIPRRVAERRTHPRYGFNAAAELTEEASSTQIKARIADISERGCYVENDRPFPLGTGVRVQITKDRDSFVAPARVVYSSAKGMGLAFGQLGENQLEVLEIWLGPLRERDWLVQNRRKTQRVIMRVPVRISGQNSAGSQFQEETHTLAVNANGALVVLSVSVKKGQVLHLLNVAMGDKAECVVAYLGQRQDDLAEIGIAFRLPNPNFWRVAFPPRDWTHSSPEEF
jgi:PilZ domain-containing protein